MEETRIGQYSDVTQLVGRLVKMDVPECIGDLICRDTLAVMSAIPAILCSHQGCDAQEELAAYNNVIRVMMAGSIPAIFDVNKASRDVLAGRADNLQLIHNCKSYGTCRRCIIEPVSTMIAALILANSALVFGIRMIPTDDIARAMDMVKAVAAKVQSHPLGADYTIQPAASQQQQPIPGCSPWDQIVRLRANRPPRVLLTLLVDEDDAHDTDVADIVLWIRDNADGDFDWLNQQQQPLLYIADLADIDGHAERLRRIAAAQTAQAAQVAAPPA